MVDRNFTTAPEYFKNATRFSRTDDYYSGRISEENREKAFVSVELECNDIIIKIKRSIFNNGKLITLSLKRKSTGLITGNYNKENHNDIDSLYQKTICELSGLSDFSQYVFLVHFLEVFDESRHLLLWNEGILTNALYIAFGTDPETAATVDKLQNEMEREASRGRNSRFGARQVTTRIEQLIDIIKNNNDNDYEIESEIIATHEKLKGNLTTIRRRVKIKQLEKKDLELKCAELSALSTSFKVEYRKAFSSRLSNISHIKFHPLIKTTLEEHKCGLCECIDIPKIELIEKNLNDNICPLCNTDISNNNQPDDESAINNLKYLDKKLDETKIKIEETLLILERVNSELNASEAQESAASEALKSFENKETNLLLKEVLPQDTIIKKELLDLEEQKERFIKQSEVHYKKRDEIRDKLRQHEKQLKLNYTKYAESFVSRFRELAEEFIGLSVDVSLDHRQGKTTQGFGLSLTMNEKLRASSDKLSESQRFFIDIALRMALSEFMCVGPSTLLIDTPEGSLDIAYEARAGSMFSKYVSRGNYILMTANLRSSYLVLRLADIQKKEKMQIVKMTEWTSLSQVQKSEESLFLDAYRQIEAAME